MGITGLYKFIKQKAPSCVSEHSIDHFAGKTAALDGNAFAYKFLHFYGRDIVKMSEEMKLLAAFLRDNHVTAVFVFDGPGVVPEKERTLKLRQLRREDNTQKAGQLQTELRSLYERRDKLRKRRRQEDSDDDKRDSPPAKRTNIAPLEHEPPRTNPEKLLPPPADRKDAEQKAPSMPAETEAEAETKDQQPNVQDEDPEHKALALQIESLENKLQAAEKQSLRVTQQDVDHMARDLTADGFVCLRSPSESDFVLAHLSRQGIVDLVFGDDGDFFPQGVNMVVRNLHKHRSSRVLLDCYDRQEMLRCLKLTQAQFVDLCILMESDYATTISNIGPVKGYQGIAKHKTIERFVKSLAGKKRHTYEPTFLEEIERARVLFLSPPPIPDAELHRCLAALADVRAKRQAI